MFISTCKAILSLFCCFISFRFTYTNDSETSLSPWQSHSWECWKPPSRLRSTECLAWPPAVPSDYQRPQQGSGKVQPSFPATATAGLKGSTASTSDLIISKVEFNGFLALNSWVLGYIKNWVQIKVLACIFLEESKAILKLSRCLK